MKNEESLKLQEYKDLKDLGENFNQKENKENNRKDIKENKLVNQSDELYTTVNNTIIKENEI